MLKRRIVLICIVLLFLISSICGQVNATEITNTQFDNTVRHHKIDPIQVPETNINLKISNLGSGCNVYLLLSESLIQYNLDKYLNNNFENDFLTEAKKARQIKEFSDTKDYLGYIEFLREFGFETDEENEIELRHYCFCIGEQHEVIGYFEHNSYKYIQIKLHLNNDNEFKLIMKDYLVNYNSLDTKFLIEEYGAKTFIDLESIGFANAGDGLRVCNVNFEYQPKEDYEAIENATRIAYLIIYIILIIIALIILVLLIRRIIKKKKEKEERKFWKKKLTKEEKQEQKRQIKELKNKNRKKNKM